jgi:hypothetical protein
VYLVKTSASRDSGHRKLRQPQGFAREIQSLLPNPTPEAHAVGLLKNPSETAQRKPHATRTLFEKPVGSKILLHPFGGGSKPLIAFGKSVLTSQHKQSAKGTLEFADEARWFCEGCKVGEKLPLERVPLRGQDQPQPFQARECFSQNHQQVECHLLWRAAGQREDLARIQRDVDIDVREAMKLDRALQVLRELFYSLQWITWSQLALGRRTSKSSLLANCIFQRTGRMPKASAKGLARRSLEKRGLAIALNAAPFPST